MAHSHIHLLDRRWLGPGIGATVLAVALAGCASAPPPEQVTLGEADVLAPQSDWSALPVTVRFTEEEIDFPYKAPVTRETTYAYEVVIDTSPTVDFSAVIANSPPGKAQIQYVLDGPAAQPMEWTGLDQGRIAPDPDIYTELFYPVADKKSAALFGKNFLNVPSSNGCTESNEADPAVRCLTDASKFGRYAWDTGQKLLYGRSDDFAEQQVNNVVTELKATTPYLRVSFDKGTCVVKVHFDGRVEEMPGYKQGPYSGDKPVKTRGCDTISQ